MIDVISTKLIRAAKAKKCKQIAITGGVSANQTLVKTVSKNAKAKGIYTFSPPIALCGDNAAMIAARGYAMIQQGNTCRVDHDVFSRTRID